MRIVADTNTVLSGLLWQGPPRRLLDLARGHRITICTSRLLLAELAEVIGREKFAPRILAANLSASGLVRNYASLCETVDTKALPAHVSRMTTR